jgi:hypothetical protein
LSIIRERCCSFERLHAEIVVDDTDQFAELFFAEPDAKGCLDPPPLFG